MPSVPPDVILVGKDDDAPGIWCLHESPDHLIEFSWLWLPGNLDGLGNTDTPWVSEMPKSAAVPPIHPPGPPPLMTVAGAESSKGPPQGAPSRLPIMNPVPYLTAYALSNGPSIGSFMPQTPLPQAHQPLGRSAQMRQPHSRHSCPRRPAWTRSSIPMPARCPPWPGPGRSQVAPRGRRSHSVWSR